MINSIYVKEICEVVQQVPDAYSTIFKHSKKYLGDYIVENTPLLDGFKFSTRVYWIMHGITEFPKCKYCGKAIKRELKISSDIPQFCCNSHQSKYFTQQKFNSTAESVIRKYPNLQQLTYFEQLQFLVKNIRHNILGICLKSTTMKYLTDWINQQTPLLQKNIIQY